MNLSVNIAKYRGAAGETQGQLADLLGVSNRTVSKWECGDGEPDIAALMKIAEHYGVTLDALCGYDAEKVREKEEVSADEAALRAFSDAFETVNRLRYSIREEEHDRFVPPSLLRPEYQKSNCAATGVFSSRVYSIFVNSRENNMALTLLRNRENFRWLDTEEERLTELLAFLADPDIRKLIRVLFTDTFPFRYTAEYAAEKAGIGTDKAKAFLEYAVRHTDVELLEGTCRVYEQIDCYDAGLIMAVFCCAYETLPIPGRDTFEVYRAGYQPILGDVPETVGNAEETEG